jgi:hypothetical protein
MTYEKLIQQMDEKLQFPGALEYLDKPGRKPSGYGADRHQDTVGHEGAGAKCGWHSAVRFVTSDCSLDCRRCDLSSLRRSRGMITSTIHVLILVPVFFVMMKERALRKGRLHSKNQITDQTQPLQLVIQGEI